MNILYLAHRIPYPPNKGEKIRAFHQIQEFARNHTVHVCCFVDDPIDLPHVPALRRYCASLEVVYRSDARAVFRGAVAFLMRYPLSISLFYCEAFAEKVRQKLVSERFDCIVCSSSSMAQYTSLADAIPKVIDFIDVDSEKWRLYAQRHAFPLSIIYRLEGEWLAKYEEAIAQAFDHSILSSEEEQRLLQERIRGRVVSVISNGVDLQYFSRRETDMPQASPPNIVFTGVMDYFPNVDAVQYFAQEILPIVRDTIPEAWFFIVGRNPSRGVKRLEKEPNVMVTGAVADVRPYLAGASVSVAPFRIAMGVQNKVLESMAMGVPVVGTTLAFKGLRATERDGVRMANDPSSFGQQVVTFLRSDALRQEAGLQAYAYVDRHHRWEDQGAKLERLIEEVVRRHRQKENIVHGRGTEYAEARL